MSWENKQDYCECEIEGKLLVKTANLNRQGQYLEKHGALGSYKAKKAFGETANPANTYTIEAKFAFEDGKLGNVQTVDGKCYALETVKWSTGADQEPTFEATAHQVEDGAQTTNYFAIPEFELSPDHIAQIPAFKFGDADAVPAFSLPAGTQQEPKNVGCELTKCDGEVSCSVKTNDKNGYPYAHDVTNGHIVLQITIGQYGEQTPEITPAAGWEISSPLTVDDPDSDMPTWSGSLTYSLLEKTMASNED